MISHQASRLSEYVILGFFLEEEVDKLFILDTIQRLTKLENDITDNVEWHISDLLQNP